MPRVREWLAPFTWDIVTAQNAVLCQAKHALHKPTSDGHDRTKQLWENQHREAMPLDAAVDLCRRCHRLAPFCFYNGNTFASTIALVIKKLELPADRAYVVRSLARHIVAGVATSDEERAFRDFCGSLDTQG
ncbi:MAG: hypothetical protein HY736_18815 [Verrucomicrobia bacterium]|nr:hypothetical protein [Verrucomicrobiota bacterium]